MTAASVRGHVALHPRGVLGHVYDPADLARRWTVELLVDGWAVALARADAFAPDLAEIGDGCYGFGFEVAASLLDGEAMIDVRLANTEASVAAPLRLSRASRPEPPPVGRVGWTGGLRLTGWVAPDEAATPGVVAIVERREVAAAAARGWTSVRQGAARRTMAAFTLDLPAGYADGRVHRVTVLDRAGRALAGSPCAVLAFPDGLRHHLMSHAGIAADDPRVAVVERCLPASIPFADWMAWRGRQSAPRPPAGTGPVVVVLVGDAPEASLASLEGQDGVDWTAVQAPPRTGPGTFAPEALRHVLESETEAAAVVVALAGTLFEPGAVARLAEAAQRHAAVVYGDALGGGEEGAAPLLWPAYDAERQLEQGYAALAFAAPRGPVVAALGRGAASLFDLVLDLAAGLVGGAGPVHLPEPLARLPRLEPELALALARAAASRIDGQATVLRQAPGALPAVQLRRRPGEAVLGVAVVQPDGTSADLDRLARLLGPAAGERILVTQRPTPVPAGWSNLVVPGWRNPSRLRDAALRRAADPRLLLLDAGLYPAEAEALAEMAGRFEAEGVAAVSGLDVTPDGIVLSAGMVLGPDFDAVAAFAGARRGEAGHAGGLRVARGCGALDARCLLVDRERALAVGGFDAVLFPEHYGGVDLALKLRAAGGRLLVTPHAVFVEAAAWPAPPAATRAAERRHLRDRWAERLADDPFYHPALNRDVPPFSGIAWPPRPCAPRGPDGEVLP